MTNDFRSYDHKQCKLNDIVRTKIIYHYILLIARYLLLITRNTNTQPFELAAIHASN